MAIGFDPPKSEKNERERGFGFDFAGRVFEGDPQITFSRVEDGEVRLKAIGLIDGVVYAVIFNERGPVRWIMSARRASRKERRKWAASS